MLNLPTYDFLFNLKKELIRYLSKLGPSNDESAIFFQLESTSRFQCWWKMVLTVEGGRSNCATTYFCRIFPIQFEHIFCGQLVAGEWW